MTVLHGHKQTVPLRLLVSPEFVAWLTRDVCPMLGTWSAGPAARALLYTIWREDIQRKREVA